MKDLHITRHEEGWQLKEEKSTIPMAVFKTQSEAIATGSKIANTSDVELFIHGRDGRIRERNSFGKDPFPPKG